MLDKIRHFLGSIFSNHNDHNIFAIGSSHFALSSKNYSKIKNLNEVEFKVFSQNGEDGIIDYLLYSLNIQKPKFLEIGVGDYRESNTRYLFMKSPNKGMIIDNETNLRKKVSRNVKLWKGDLTIIEKKIDSENILDIIKENNFGKNLDLLSLDIDGVDYWILKEFPKDLSKIFVTEYNAIFGPDLEITVPNIKNFDRTDYHHSNLCYGMSLRANVNLMIKKNYVFIGANKACNNAFFVHKNEIEKININLPSLNSLDIYTQSNIRESRSESGDLTFLSGEQKLRAISDCKVINLDSKSQNPVLIKDLFNI